MHQRPGSRYSTVAAAVLLFALCIWLSTMVATGQDGAAGPGAPEDGTLTAEPTLVTPTEADTPTDIPTEVTPTEADTPTDIPTEATLPPTAPTVEETPTNPPIPETVTPGQTEPATFTPTPKRKDATATEMSLTRVIGTFTTTPAIAPPILPPPTTPPATFTPSNGRPNQPRRTPTPYPLPPEIPPPSPPPATLAAVPAVPCTGRFIPYDLPHVTASESGGVEPFEALGAGVAVADLDGDGDLDIVLGGHSGRDSLLWNEGRLRFRWEAFGSGGTRAVNAVDVDGDGWLDIVLTRHDGAVDFWRSQGQAAVDRNQIGHTAQFVRQPLPGVNSPAFAMAWADLDLDGDLDLVTASNATAPTETPGNGTGESAGGIIVYENSDLIFTPTLIATTTVALAIALFDLDDDGRLDLIVGNEEDLPDQVWLNQDGAWLAASPLEPQSAVSAGFDWGDLDNDGAYELFATGRQTGDNAGAGQNSGNRLFVRTAPAAYADQAAAWGIAATGWSWSGQFGDFENDGYLDLYAVNGMIDATRFPDLPSNELVEENQAFHNSDGTGFVPMPAWGLGSTRSGRGMVVADLDNDGELDIVVNNLRMPAQLFENRLCREDWIEVDLFWPQSANTRGVGAQITLLTGDTTYRRDVRVATGYLSGGPPRVHIGFPRDTQLQALEVRWPDGVLTVIDELEPNTFIEVRRTE